MCMGGQNRPVTRDGFTGDARLYFCRSRGFPLNLFRDKVPDCVGRGVLAPRRFHFLLKSVGVPWPLLKIPGFAHGDLSLARLGSVAGHHGGLLTSQFLFGCIYIGHK